MVRPAIRVRKSAAYSRKINYESRIKQVIRNYGLRFVKSQVSKRNIICSEYQVAEKLVGGKELMHWVKESLV